jgi:hypothetical protein
VNEKKKTPTQKNTQVEATDELTPRLPFRLLFFLLPIACCLLLPVVACCPYICSLFAFLTVSNSLFSSALNRFTVLCFGKGNDDDNSEDNDDDNEDNDDDDDGNGKSGKDKGGSGKGRQR